MAEKLKITISVAKRPYPMNIAVQEEFFVREAARLLNEQMQQYKQDLKMTDPQDLLAMVAIDCMVTNLKLNENYKNLQHAVSQRVGSLSDLLTPALND
ncbi:MAG: cell division protein ZapA [Cytophagaceae bacterium]|nr:cell division protein ZapA [Cytophagaceae bacterium]